VTTVPVALGILSRGGRCFLQRRPCSTAFLPGAWEFPGGKVEADEEPVAALRRELAEELALELPCEGGGVEALPVQEHAYADRTVRLHPFLVAVPGQPRTTLAWGWFTLQEMLRLPVPAANLPLLEALSPRAKEA
jgi:8-oxo-dGTP diphosphatase